MRTKQAHGQQMRNRALQFGCLNSQAHALSLTPLLPARTINFYYEFGINCDFNSSSRASLCGALARPKTSVTQSLFPQVFFRIKWAFPPLMLHSFPSPHAQILSMTGSFGVNLLTMFVVRPWDSHMPHLALGGI